MRDRCLVLMCGLPAAGKTATAARLHAYLGGALIRSCDVFRDLGISLPEWIERTRGFRGGVEPYLRLRDDAYTEMAARAERALVTADVVIVDAVHGELDKRHVLYELAAAHRAEAVVVVCRCDDLAETRRRIEARRGREHTPEHEACDFSVYEDLARRWQPPDPGEAAALTIVTVDTWRGGVDARGAGSASATRLAAAVRAVVTA